MNDLSRFAVGGLYHGFELERKEYIQEIDSTVFFFRHLILGTPALAIKNDDANKTFCFAFQTVPTDSTGVAHILEHSVLMGSEKYPVRDVFGEINKGGLMTFLNAMTGSDTTWYPFATRNITEYFNIMDVYCDVVLNPLLERSTFEQEGWHYHLESPDEPLQYQGVVYNEMKGAFSDPFRHLFHHAIRTLMPGSTYAHESGGDPAVIPQLSYDQFVDFHRRHYHPSNGMLFFYGDADLDRELAYVQESFLCRYDEAGERACIENGDPVQGPVFVTEPYGIQPGGPTEGKTFLAVGTLTGTVLERKKNIALQVIANILYNSDASPLKNAIIQAGLCRDFGGFFVTSSSFKTFMLTYLIGCEKDNRDRFLKLYTQTLGDMAEQGLSSELILSELNKYEFSVREEMNKAQRGLDLISKALPAIKYGADPFAALQVEQLFAEIREEAMTGQFFESLIREHLLDQRDSAIVTLVPDPDLLARNQQEEQERLRRHAAAIGEEGLEKILARTRELLKLQNKANDPETLALLPSLTLADLDPDPSFFQAREERLQGVPCIVSELNTNGIAYIDIGFDCRGIGLDLLPFLDLFATIVTEIGTDELDFMQFAMKLNTCAGGFSHSFATYSSQKEGIDEVRPILWFQLKSLSASLADALALVSDLLRNVSFHDRARIRDIVQREFAWAEHSVQSEGYGLAATRVFSHLSLAGQYSEQVTGASAYLALKKLAADYDQQEEQFFSVLKMLRTRLLVRERMLSSITANKKDIDCFGQSLASLAEPSLRQVDLSPCPPFPEYPRRQAFCTSAEVLYNVQGCRLFSDTKQYNGAFEVLKTWLSRDYLWNSVRQTGGAYGCFIQFNQRTGTFALISYRDPQLERTFAAYDSVWREVEQLELGEAVMTQLIIGTYGAFDPHQGPPAKGATARNELLFGITPAFKGRRIREIIAARADSMQKYAPYLKNLAEKGYRATIGNGAKIRESSDFFDEIIDL